MSPLPNYPHPPHRRKLTAPAEAANSGWTAHLRGPSPIAETPLATPEPRYCPSCATPTPARYCPNDGVATFVRKLVAPSAAYLSAGDVVADKFRVQTLIGVGGFGAVYEAEHTGGLGHVAIKVLSPGDHNESEIRRFYREAQVTAGLRHANTVRVFDVGQLDSGVLYIAMERVRGHSLEDELRARQERGEAMTEAETLDIGIGTLKSLSEAHAKGLVHRDLKPANLMLTEVDGERHVKVLDFGIALVKGSSLTGSGQALGTPAYMSPEQCTGAPVDGRSDLYSLGILLYRCLTGDVPFRDVNPLAVMMAQTTATPPPLVTLVKEPVCLELVDAINRAMEKAPERRFADAREMRSALEAAQRAAVSIGGVEAHDPHRGWAARYQEYNPDAVPGTEGVTSAGKQLAATECQCDRSGGHADRPAARVGGGLWGCTPRAFCGCCVHHGRVAAHRKSGHAGRRGPIRQIRDGLGHSRRHRRGRGWLGSVGSADARCDTTARTHVSAASGVTHTPHSCTSAGTSERSRHGRGTTSSRFSSACNGLHGTST